MLKTQFGYITTSNSRVSRLSLLIAAGTLAVITPGKISAQTIVTVAGDGVAGYTGDDIPALKAELNQPTAVAMDRNGDLFIADAANDVIRKVSRKNGMITTVAGAAFACGDSGDNGPADEALLCSPDGITVDRLGNLLIADTANHRIRRVDHRTHIITTVAGTGVIGFSGDGGPATSAQLAAPNDVKVDAFDNLYIADTANFRVRRVDARTGIIQTAVGNGTGGDGSLAVDAQIGESFGLAFDHVGNLFIGDSTQNSVHRVDRKTGILTTVAGSGVYGYSGDGGQATAAMLGGPFGVAVDKRGFLYIGDEGNERVRRVDLHTGIITTYAGNGVTGFSGDHGPALEAEFRAPSGVLLDGADRLYIADQSNQRIRLVDHQDCEEDKRVDPEPIYSK
jgi:trimeric autotransporter adhesin